MFPHEVVEKVGTGAKKESLKEEGRGGEERKEKETPSRKSSLRRGSLSIRRFWGKVGTREAKRGENTSPLRPLESPLPSPLRKPCT